MPDPDFLLLYPQQGPSPGPMQGTLPEEPAPPPREAAPVQSGWDRSGRWWWNGTSWVGPFASPAGPASIWFSPPLGAWGLVIALAVAVLFFGIELILIH